MKNHANFNACSLQVKGFFMKKYVLNLNKSNLDFIKELLKGKTFSISGRLNDLEYADGTVDAWKDSANKIINAIFQSFGRRLQPNDCFYFFHGQFDREEREYFIDEEGWRVKGFRTKYGIPSVPTEIFYDGYYNVIVIKTREHSIKAMFSKYFI